MRFQACTIVRQFLRVQTIYETALLSNCIPKSSFEVTSRFSGSFPVPQSATFLQDDKNAKVVLLGTVHFSKQSIEDVSEIVKHLNPNAILVELCRQRVSLLELDDKQFLEDAKNFDARKFKEAAKGQNFVSGMLHAMLLKTYADIAKELGVAPGGEFRRAYHEMKKIPGCKLFLGDRPIQITIARAFQSLSVYELGQVLYHLTTANPKPLDKHQLEKYKDKDFVQAQFEEITRDVPAFKKIFHVFVDERDKCLAYSIQECVRSVKKPRVLAVVGMGHVDGISKYYGKMKQEHIIPLLVIPPEPLYKVFIRKGLKFTFYFMIFSFFYRLLFG
ncbi:traB domain-containing protein-like isoform X2 [Hyposmocoma kahamanoa]|uniref:traB domain-containing protein-like isoform X2 n=1 Tax=Hyposmocoma kahamanoa TaxID=1477025 RepID=UPI000E6D9805|nr:traB domain-containing protein-like isoform X2 [Hyposmocoma kahamanoa]